MGYQKNKFGSIVMDGFTITPKEQRDYILNVKRSNSKRDYLIDKFYSEAQNTPNMKGVSKEAYTMVLQEKGFIPEKLTTSFKGLGSKEEFKQELKDIHTINRKGYHDKKVDTLRKTMLRQLKNNLGHESTDMINTIKNLSNSELASLYIHSSKDILRDIFGSPTKGKNNASENFEDQVEKTRSAIHMAVRNTIPKEARAEKIAELGKPKRNKIIKGKRNKIAKQR